MAEVSPFQGWRVNSCCAASVSAQPYDVVDEREARVIASDNPDTFLRVTKPEIQTPPSADEKEVDSLALAALALASLKTRGILIQDPRPVFYVYRLVMEGRSQTGLVACVSADDYERGVIRRHELTRRDKEDERARHIAAVQAHTGPVLLAYRAEERVRTLMRRIETAEPDCDFTCADGIGHTLWTVSDPDDIAQVQDLFSTVPRLYIADGHHRAAAAARVWRLASADPSPSGTAEAYRSFLAVLFPADELHIMGYHRVIKDLNGMSTVDFTERLKKAGFVLKPSPSAPTLAVGQIGMLLDGQWHLMQVPSDPEAAAAERLDAAVLQNRVLEPILGIRDIRTDPRVDFVGGLRGMPELERHCRNDAVVAFALAPVTMDQIMAVADADGIMPPKSTWFEPKLRSGLVVHAVEP